MYSACIWIASKMEDMTPPRSEDLVYISDFSFTPDKLRSLETRICKVLQFRLHRVTPFHFVHVNLRASQACAAPNCHHFLGRASAMQQMTLYLLEISRSCYLLSHRKPSLIAAACVYLARATLGVGEKVQQHGSKGGDGNNSHGSVSVYWTKTLEYYTGYTVSDLKDTVLKIHRLQISAEKSSNGVAPAFSKYKTEANLRVSLRTVRRVEELGFFGTTEMMTMIKHDDMIVDDENAVVL